MLVFTYQSLSRRFFVSLLLLLATTANLHANSTANTATTRAFLKEIVLQAQAYSHLEKPIPEHLLTHFSEKSLHHFAEQQAQHKALIQDFDLHQSTAFERIEQTPSQQSTGNSHWTILTVRTLTNAHAAIKEFIQYDITLQPTDNKEKSMVFPYRVIAMSSSAYKPTQGFDFEQLRSASCPKKADRNT